MNIWLDVAKSFKAHVWIDGDEGALYHYSSELWLDLLWSKGSKRHLFMHTLWTTSPHLLRSILASKSANYFWIGQFCVLVLYVVYWELFVACNICKNNFHGHVYHCLRTGQSEDECEDIADQSEYKQLGLWWEKHFRQMLFLLGLSWKVLVLLFYLFFSSWLDKKQERMISDHSASPWDKV